MTHAVGFKLKAIGRIGFPMQWEALDLQVKALDQQWKVLDVKIKIAARK